MTGAGPIFHAVMLAAARRAGSDSAREILPPPAGLREETICALSGMPATPWCPARVKEWVGDGGRAPCDWHVQADAGVATVYPPEYRAWIGSRVSRPVPQMMEAADLRPSEPKAPGQNANHTGEAVLDIANPPPGAFYSIDPTLRREFQSIPLRAIATRPTMLTWLVDGAPVGSASSERTVSWPLAAGKHDIEVRDADGRTARASVVVK